MSDSGYVCVPYLPNGNEVRLKETLEKSNNIHDMYFVTATFSEDGNAYFPSRSNIYLLARFKNQIETLKEVEKFKQEKPAFVFTQDDEFFERLNDEKPNLISVYYLEQTKSESDLHDLALIIARRNRVRRAEMGSLKLSTTQNPKFTFPYGNNLVVLETSSDNSHQSDNKYCEKTRKEVQRKGIRMTTLLNLSVIEKIK